MLVYRPFLNYFRNEHNVFKVCKYYSLVSSLHSFNATEYNIDIKLMTSDIIYLIQTQQNSYH